MFKNRIDSVINFFILSFFTFEIKKCIVFENIKPASQRSNIAKVPSGFFLQLLIKVFYDCDFSLKPLFIISA